MTLPEKILYCRKKAGMSQEALADQIGVSRQSVSKWETGDAVPEINKLLLLANAFHVTTDWLLNEASPVPQSPPEPVVSQGSAGAGNTWVDAVPGMIGRLLRRYGWLFGVYLAVIGAAFTGLGALARALTRSMLSSSIPNTFGGSSVYFNQLDIQASSPFADFATNNPVSIMGSVMIALGIVMLIVGVVIAVILKNRSQE